MAELKFETSDLAQIPQGVKVRLSGIIDVTTADTFRATLLTLLSVGFRRILLDFREVEFVNSAGFASMVELSQHLRDTGGIVVLNQMRPQVEDICVSLGLDAWFGISHDDDAAQKLLRESNISPMDDFESDDADAVGFYIGPGESSAELVAIGPRSDSVHDVPPLPGESGDGDAGASDGFMLQQILDYRSTDDNQFQDAKLDEDLWADSEDTTLPVEDVVVPADAAAVVDDDYVPAGSHSGAGSDVDDLEPADDDGEAEAIESDFSPAGAASEPEASAADDDADDADGDVDFMPAGASAELAIPDFDADAEPSDVDFTPAGGSEDAHEVAAVVDEDLDFSPAGAAAATSETPSADRMAAIEERLRSGMVESQPLSPAPAPTVQGKAAVEPPNVMRSRSAADRAREEAKAEAERLAKARQPAGKVSSKGGDSPRSDALKAIASMLSATPENDRLWRKVLVYLTKDAKTQTPALNLVIAKVPNKRITKDSFPATTDNPYVTIKPQIPGGICVPEMLAVDVTKGGDEVTFKIMKDTNPDRPNATKGKSRLEIWYGPALVRTVQTPNPFE